MDQVGSSIYKKKLQLLIEQGASQGKCRVVMLKTPEEDLETYFEGA